MKGTQTFYQHYFTETTLLVRLKAICYLCRTLVLKIVTE